jgi:putative ABC transport system substrate-binding protein
MRRRDFIKVIGGTVAWPLAAHAQQPLPVVGHICGESAERWTDRLHGLARGLNEAGYFEGRNVLIEHRWAEANYDQLPTLVADLIGRRVAVIVADGAPAAVAAKASNTIIPIVFFTGGDPVHGLVASLNRPGGNLTGVSVMNVELATKRLELLHELMPGAARFAILVNPKNPLTEPVIAPTNLPVMQPTKLEFVINLQAAKMLGMTIPSKLLALADEVIE